MNAGSKRLILAGTALLLSATGLLVPNRVLAHDRDEYSIGYERGYENGYRVGYGEAANGQEYSNHFPDGYDAYGAGFHDGQHAGYDKGYRVAWRRWHRGYGW
jgi:hypothetical protein